ncbi:MAG: hypothetical protein RI907_2044 [Pseudomonadota bacterium]|jgi:uroporphyrinogen-III synthase
MAPTVLVTRPEPQASRWAAALRQAGLQAHALPLMATQAAAQPGPVHALWRDLAADLARPKPSTPRWRALMFVSPAAVQWFFQQRPAELPPLAWPADTWVACPGLGTAAAVQEALKHASGPAPTVLHPAADAEQFDSEHLWPVLAERDWSGQRVAIVSGGDAEQAQGRRWLTERWQAAGAEVVTVLTYQRGPAPWSPQQAQLARTAWLQPASHVWLASSSDALALLHTHHLPALAAPAATEAQRATPGHRLLATHPRIAENALTWGWQDIALCAPTLDAVVRSLQGRSDGLQP